MKKKCLLVLAPLSLILLFPLAYFFYCKMTLMGMEDDATIAYLLSHKYPVDAEDIRIPLSFGKGIEMGKDHVFLFGETHGFSPSQLMDAKLLIYLNKNHDVRTYGAEIFAEDAHKLNQVLGSEQLDERLLVSVINDISRDTPQSKTVDCLNKWKLIYDYNRQVDKEHKIYVLGLLGKKNAYQENLRDEVMARTFQTFANDPRNEDWVRNGCYCFVGLTHAYQSPYLYKGHEIPTFGSILKEHLFSVTSMIQMSIDSYCYLPKNDEMISPPGEKTKYVSSNGPICFYNNVVNLEKASEGVKAAIYSLGDEDSPFWSCDDLVGYRSSIPSLVQPYSGLSTYSTMDYFQYVFLIRDAQAPKAI